MCPKGRERYERMLGELGDDRFRPKLCDECKAKKPGPNGEPPEVCRDCATKALTFHGWIRDGVFYDTRDV
jgi:hypothetical protein